MTFNFGTGDGYLVHFLIQVCSRLVLGVEKPPVSSTSASGSCFLYLLNLVTLMNLEDCLARFCVN